MYGLQGNYSDRKEFSYTRPVLVDVLAQQGYKLGLFRTNSFDISQNPHQSLFEGFEVFASDGDNGSADADIKSVNQFIQWQQAQTTPWFSVVNLAAPKDYDTPVGFLGIETIKPTMDLKPAQKVLFNQYRQSLHFIDKQLETLLAQVSNDTIVLITGTHGQVFSSDSSVIKQDLSPDNVKVPLIVHWPDNHKGLKVSYRTSHNAIAPTLLSQVLGCTNPSTDYSSGRSLLEPNGESWVYIGNSRVFAIYQKNEITVLDRAGKYSIYDLNFENRLNKKMSAPELIQVMREGRRLYSQ